MSNDIPDVFLDALDATSNKVLQELVDEWREKAEHTEVFKPSAARGMELVYRKNAYQLEEMINNKHDKQCDAKGPDDLVCTRHGSDHRAHVTYREVNGDLNRIEWFSCNPLGEPTDDT